MDLTALTTQLRKSIHNPTTTQVADAELWDCINLAYRQIASRFRFHRTISRVTFSTVYAQVDYALAANVLVVYKLWNRTTNRELRSIDNMQLYINDGTTQYPTEYGEPVAYHRSGNNLQLYRPPDAVYAMEYSAKILPAVMTTGADIPTLPDTWHEAIAYLARWYYFDRNADYPKATYAMNAYKLWLSDRSNEVDEESVSMDESVDVFPPSVLNARHLTNGDW